MKKKTFLAPLLLGIFVLTILSFFGAKVADAATNSEALSIVKNEVNQCAEIDYYVPKNLQGTYTLLVDGEEVSHYTSLADYSADGIQNVGETIKLWKLMPDLSADDVVTLVNSNNEIIARQLPPIDALPDYDAKLSIVKNETNLTSQINIVKDTLATTHYKVLVNGTTLFESNKDVHSHATASQKLSGNKTKVWKLTPLKVGDIVELVTTTGNFIDKITVTQDMISDPIAVHAAVDITDNAAGTIIMFSEYADDNKQYTVYLDGKKFMDTYVDEGKRRIHMVDGSHQKGNILTMWKSVIYARKDSVVTIEARDNIYASGKVIKEYKLDETMIPNPDVDFSITYDGDMDQYLVATLPTDRFLLNELGTWKYKVVSGVERSGEMERMLYNNTVKSPPSNDFFYEGDMITLFYKGKPIRTLVVNANQTRYNYTKEYISFNELHKNDKIHFVEINGFTKNTVEDILNSSGYSTWPDDIKALYQ